MWCFLGFFCFFGLCCAADLGVLWFGYPVVLGVSGCHWIDAMETIFKIPPSLASAELSLMLRVMLPAGTVRSPY